MKKSNTINIVMFGPSLDAQGGISSVERTLLSAGLLQKVRLYFISTTNGRHDLVSMLCYFHAIIGVLYRCATGRKDIFHIHVSQKGSFFRKFAIFCLGIIFRKRILLHLHGSQFDIFMTSNRLIMSLIRFMFSKADKVVVLSNFWNRKLRALTGKDNVVTIYNPVASIGEKMERDSNDVNVLFLGRLGRRKGVYDLVECISRDKEIFKQNTVKFIIAGDGEVDAIRSLVRQKGLEDICNVPGWISGDKKEAHLKNASILVLPSYDEQMPMSILEAMSYGMPILATNIAGIPEMVEHGGNGYLFEPGDIVSMSRFMIELVSNNVLRASMGRMSREIVQKKFDSSLIVDQLVKTYCDISAEAK